MRIQHKKNSRAKYFTVEPGVFKKNKKEAKRKLLKELADKEILFQQRCATYELSPREVEVLRVILEGHTYKSAAELLFVSENHRCVPAQHLCQERCKKQGGACRQVLQLNPIG